MVKRLRYSVSDEQWALIEEAAKALSLDPKVVLQFSTSLGLRFLDISLIHPLGGGIGKALDARVGESAAALAGELGKAMMQQAPSSEVLLSAEVASPTRKVAARRKASRKGK